MSYYAMKYKFMAKRGFSVLEAYFREKTSIFTVRIKDLT